MQSNDSSIVLVVFRCSSIRAKEEGFVISKFLIKGEIMASNYCLLTCFHVLNGLIELEREMGRIYMLSVFGNLDHTGLF